jgi:glycosyltransferase involved in cell wall biosynthesis
VRIAQVAPLHEAVPPKLYGGTERVVSYLTEELVRQGHEVTLFASGDSQTAAHLVPICRKALRLDTDCQSRLPHQVLALEAVIRQWHGFDVVHFHEDWLHLPWLRRSPRPGLITMHGRLDLPDFAPLYREYDEIPLVSISDDQRKPLAWANWRATIHHGLPEGLYRFRAEHGRYLAFLGRICPEKRVDRAIDIAKRAGVRLRIAAKVDPVDEAYFEREIRQLIEDPLIDFVGEIGEDEKGAFLGGALALVFPIDWPEPFGLAVIEANACGTPVIAFARGSMPELIADGVNGFLVEDVGQAVAAVERVKGLERTRCRRTFEERFSVSRMARDYIAVYDELARESWAACGMAAD